MSIAKTVLRAEVSMLAHATEDQEKVQEVIWMLFPTDSRRREIFTRCYLKGHHGNPIVTFTAKLNESDQVEKFIRYFFARLPEGEKKLIKAQLPMRLDDEGNFFIRLDKQLAYRGVLKLAEEDPIKVRLKFNRSFGDPRHLLKELLG